MANQEFGFIRPAVLPSKREVLEGIERELGIKQEGESGNTEYLDLEKKLFEEEADSKESRAQAGVCAFQLASYVAPLVERRKAIDGDRIRAFLGQFQADLNSSRESQPERQDLPGAQFNMRNLYGAIRREISRLRDIDRFLEQDHNKGIIRTFQALRTAVFDTWVEDHRKAK